MYEEFVGFVGAGVNCICGMLQRVLFFHRESILLRLVFLVVIVGCKLLVFSVMRQFVHG